MVAAESNDRTIEVGGRGSIVGANEQLPLIYQESPCLEHDWTSSLKRLRKLNLVTSFECCYG